MKQAKLLCAMIVFVTIASLHGGENKIEDSNEGFQIFIEEDEKFDIHHVSENGEVSSKEYDEQEKKFNTQQEKCSEQIELLSTLQDKIICIREKNVILNNNLIFYFSNKEKQKFLKIREVKDNVLFLRKKILHKLDLLISAGVQDVKSLLGLGIFLTLSDDLSFNPSKELFEIETIKLKQINKICKKIITYEKRKLTLAHQLHNLLIGIHLLILKGEEAQKLLNQYITEGGNLNQKDPDGDTLLHIAALRRPFDPELIKLLLLHGANRYYINNKQKTAPYYTGKFLSSEGIEKQEISARINNLFGTWKSIEEQSTVQEITTYLPSYIRKKFRYFPGQLSRAQKKALLSNTIPVACIVVHGSDTDFLGKITGNRDESGPRNPHFYDPSSEGFKGFMDFAKRYANRTGKIVDLLSFEWTGSLGDSSRNSAKQDLLNYLDSNHYRDSKLIFIAHSHGGTVVDSVLKKLKPLGDEARIALLLFYALPCRQKYKEENETVDLMERLYNAINNAASCEPCNYDQLFLFHSPGDKVVGPGSIDTNTWMTMVGSTIGGTGVSVAGKYLLHHLDKNENKLPFKREILKSYVPEGTMQALLTLKSLYTGNDPSGFEELMATVLRDTAELAYTLTGQGLTPLEISKKTLLFALKKVSPKLSLYKYLPVRKDIMNMVDVLLNTGELVYSLKGLTPSEISQKTLLFALNKILIKLPFYTFHSARKARIKKFSHARTLNDIMPDKLQKKGPKVHLEVKVDGEYIPHSSVPALAHTGRVWELLNTEYPMSIWCSGKFKLNIWTAQFLEKISEQRVNNDLLPLEDLSTQIYCCLYKDDQDKENQKKKNENINPKGTKNFYRKPISKKIKKNLKNNGHYYYLSRPFVKDEDNQYSAEDFSVHEYENITGSQKENTDKIKRKIQELNAKIQVKDSRCVVM